MLNIECNFVSLFWKYILVSIAKYLLWLQYFFVLFTNCLLFSQKLFTWSLLFSIWFVFYFQVELHFFIDSLFLLKSYIFSVLMWHSLSIFFPLNSYFTNPITFYFYPLSNGFFIPKFEVLNLVSTSSTIFTYLFLLIDYKSFSIYVQ